MLTQQTEQVTESHPDSSQSPDDRHRDATGNDVVDAIVKAIVDAIAPAIKDGAQHLGRRVDNLAREVALLTNAVSNVNVNIDVGSSVFSGGEDD